MPASALPWRAEAAVVRLSGQLDGLLLIGERRDLILLVRVGLTTGAMDLRIIRCELDLCAVVVDGGFKLPA